jgi:hypothetical protein
MINNKIKFILKINILKKNFFNKKLALFKYKIKYIFNWIAYFKIIIYLEFILIYLINILNRNKII